MTTSAEVDPNAGLERESLKNALVDSGLGIDDIYIYIQDSNLPKLFDPWLMTTYWIFANE